MIEERPMTRTRSDRIEKRPVVVVTGGSAGVGRAAVRGFAQRGYDVAILARDTEALWTAAREVEQAGGRPLAVPTDVAEAEEVERAAERVERELGAIDVWVNVAMASVFAPFWEVSPAEYERATRVTYLSFVWGSAAAVRRMRRRGSGVIVQVGSALAYRGIPAQAAYCGAKHAIVGMSESLRTELLADCPGVRVTMCHLPAMNTPQFGWVLNKLSHRPQPVPPIYQPEVAARTIVWAAEHPRRAYWVGLSTVGTIVGNRLAPGLLDRYLARTGFRSQQTDQQPLPRGHTNLFEPLPGDPGSHGTFDDHSFAHSPQAWLSRHRRVVLGGLVGAAAVGMGATSAARS
jgi:NAD(P)-dependent dehydrogenase (short-subunit alcohol dehydrogenase family)